MALDMFLLLLPELQIAIMLLIPLFYLRAVKGMRWKDIKRSLFPKYQGHKKEIIGSFKLLGALLVSFIAIMAVVYVAESALGVQINDLGKVDSVIGKELFYGGLYFVLTLPVAVFAEEFLFRAFMVPRIGVAISTAIFGALHFGYGSWLEIAGAFALGLVLAYWFKKHKSLLQNFMGHMMYNVVAIAFYALI
jgi:hypothetical protein